MHYRRWKIHGNPLYVKTPHKRFWERVRYSPYCWEWQGALGSHGYGAITINNVRYLAHRYSYKETVGDIPQGLVIDHRCHNKRCVNPSHLRPVTVKQNGENRKGLPSNNTSGIRGVTWNKQIGKWSVKVKHQGKTYYGGSFDNLEKASVAVTSLRDSLHTHHVL